MVKAWVTYLKALMGSKKGQGMVEYGLIIGVVAVMLIGGLFAMRVQLQTIFSNIATSLQNGGTPAQ